VKKISEKKKRKWSPTSLEKESHTARLGGTKKGLPKEERRGKKFFEGKNPAQKRRGAPRRYYNPARHNLGLEEGRGRQIPWTVGREKFQGKEVFRRYVSKAHKLTGSESLAARFGEKSKLTPPRQGGTGKKKKSPMWGEQCPGKREKEEVYFGEIGEKKCVRDPRTCKNRRKKKRTFHGDYSRSGGQERTVFLQKRLEGGHSGAPIIRELEDGKGEA